MKWTRELGKKSGPGNVLNGRWEVGHRAGGGWMVRDRLTHNLVSPMVFPTMKLARRRAEEAAREAES